MREIRETTQLDVPIDRAERCIMQYFDDHRTLSGKIEIPLRVRLDDFGVPGGLRLERPVTVHVKKQRDAQNLNDEIRVDWDPGESEAYPSLAGSMTVWSESPNTTLVELRGTYEPPLGAAGKMFDDTIGHLIAKATAREFLAALANGARACFTTT